MRKKIVANIVVTLTHIFYKETDDLYKLTELKAWLKVWLSFKHYPQPLLFFKTSLIQKLQQKKKIKTITHFQKPAHLKTGRLLPLL